MIISIVSGGFDPIHSGHIQYFKDASLLSNHLFVGINSDRWLTRKKGNFFMPFRERKIVVESIRYVTEAVGFNDEDDSAADLIHLIAKRYVGDPDTKILFCNGGDRNPDTPQSRLEHEAAQRYNNVLFVYGVGGTTKLNSSSSILKRWENEKSTDIRTNG